MSDLDFDPKIVSFLPAIGSVMNIGFYSDTALPRADGIAISIEAYGQAFKKLGESVDLVAPAPSYTGTIPLRKVRSFRPLRRDYQVGLILPYRESSATNADSYDVVHVHTLGPVGLTGLFAARRAGIPAVLTWHTDVLSYRRYYPELWPAAFLVREMLRRLGVESPKGAAKYEHRHIIRSIVSAFDTVIVPTPKVEKQLFEFDYNNNIVIHPSPTLPLPTSQISARQLRQDLKISATAPIVMSIGRLSGEKNQDLLVEGFARTRRQHPNAQLVLVGQLRRERVINRLAKSLGASAAVHVVGEIERAQLAAYYELADVFVIPSLSETQSLVAQEAEAFGLPVIVVDKGLLLGLHKERVFSPSDPSHLGLAISRFIDTSQGANRIQNPPADRYLPMAHDQARKLLEIYERSRQGFIDRPKTF